MFSSNKVEAWIANVELVNRGNYVRGSYKV